MRNLLVIWGLFLLLLVVVVSLPFCAPTQSTLQRLDAACQLVIASPQQDMEIAIAKKACADLEPIFRGEKKNGRH